MLLNLFHQPQRILQFVYFLGPRNSIECSLFDLLLCFVVVGVILVGGAAAATATVAVFRYFSFLVLSFLFFSTLGMLRNESKLIEFLRVLEIPRNYWEPLGKTRNQ